MSILKKKASLISLCIILILSISTWAQNRGLVNIYLPQTETNIELYNASYALVIGISDYTNGWKNLPNAVKDAIEVKKILEQQGFQVKILENPPKKQIVSEIDEFINEFGRSPQNRLLFFYAGHGYSLPLSYGRKMGYIVPSDAPLPEKNPSEFKNLAIDMQAFEYYAQKIEANHALFIFDSCFSGTIFNLSRAPSHAISDRISLPVRMFITAGDEDEKVPDKSIFKELFIAALNGEADTSPKDGYITGSELGEFLYQKVTNYTEGSQHPQYGKLRDPLLDKGDFVFELENSKLPNRIINSKNLDNSSKLIGEFGKIALLSHVEGTVYCDDDSLGIIKEGDEILYPYGPIGKHFIEVRGRKRTIVEEIVIEKGKTSKVFIDSTVSNTIELAKENIENNPNRGTLRLFLEDMGGKVYVYGKLIGEYKKGQKLDIKNIPAGRTTYVIKAKNQVITREVVIQIDRILQVRVKSNGFSGYGSYGGFKGY